MFIKIDNFLTPAQVAEWVSRIEPLPWEDGAATAVGSKNRKSNEQLTLTNEAAIPALHQASKYVMQHPRIKSWCEPRRISSIMFSRYGEGAFYGSHSDAGIFRFFPYPVRADISFTIFLNEPSQYEGGELVLESPLGETRLKSPAGTMVMYDTGIKHRIEEVLSGSRLVTVGWIESLIRDPDTRELLRDLRKVIGLVNNRGDDSEEVVTLRRIYAQILRMFGEA